MIYCHYAELDEFVKVKIKSTVQGNNLRPQHLFGNTFIQRRNIIYAIELFLYQIKALLKMAINIVNAKNDHIPAWFCINFPIG